LTRLETRLDLAGLVGLIPEPIDKFLHPRDLFGLPGRGRVELRILFRFQFLEEGIVAPVLFDLVMPQLPDMRDDTVEKGRVVADDQQRHVRVEQKLFKPALRGFVEMVGRLVEHQYVGVREQ